MHLISVNLGRATAVDYSDAPDGLTGMGKRPVPGPVRVSAPGPRAAGAGSGLEGDAVCDRRHHGGDHQAVYAYAREELDWWERELGRELPAGTFGENLTTSGVDVSGALLGERWRVGPELVLEVSSTRIPCRTFQGVMGVPGWVKRFTRERRPGAYLRVVREGRISPGDGIEVLHRPEHEVTSAFLFRAWTTERVLLPRVLAAGEALAPEVRETALAYARKHGARRAVTPGG
ncbi:MOSC domain-containing protein [Streptomyces sp. NPDC058674]|uniref:MOSC domain-containing protein n=1 Tax=Streptomyces sp. NPDC058674 TaxID=3346592 RepID=UPI003662F922